MSIPQQISVADIVNLVGRSDLIAALGLKEKSSAISNAIADNEFPANWRDVVEELCTPHGIKISGQEFKQLFKMRRAS